MGAADGGEEERIELRGDDAMGDGRQGSFRRKRFDKP